MKINFIKILIYYIIFLSSISYANSDIVYINLSKIMNDSNVGKFVNLKIETDQKKILDNFKKNEEVFRDKEKKILNQKNIIKSEEFEKKIIKLQDEIKIYNKDRKEILDKLKNKKILAGQKIIEKLNPILMNYMKENSISLILRKKDIIIGKSSLDITLSIIELLNKEISEIEF